MSFSPCLRNLSGIVVSLFLMRALSPLVGSRALEAYCLPAGGLLLLVLLVSLHQRGGRTSSPLARQERSEQCLAPPCALGGGATAEPPHLSRLRLGQTPSWPTPSCPPPSGTTAAAPARPPCGLVATAAPSCRQMPPLPDRRETARRHARCASRRCAPAEQPAARRATATATNGRSAEAELSAAASGERRSSKEWRRQGARTPDAARSTAASERFTRVKRTSPC